MASDLVDEVIEMGDGFLSDLVQKVAITWETKCFNAATTLLEGRMIDVQVPTVSLPSLSQLKAVSSKAKAASNDESEDESVLDSLKGFIHQLATKAKEEIQSHGEEAFKEIKAEVTEIVEDKVKDLKEDLKDKLDEKVQEIRDQAEAELNKANQAAQGTLNGANQAVQGALGAELIKESDVKLLFEKIEDKIVKKIKHLPKKFPDLRKIGQKAAEKSYEADAKHLKKELQKQAVKMAKATAKRLVKAAVKKLLDDLKGRLVRLMIEVVKDMMGLGSGDDDSGSDIFSSLLDMWFPATSALIATNGTVGSAGGFDMFAEATDMMSDGSVQTSLMAKVTDAEAGMDLESAATTTANSNYNDNPDSDAIVDARRKVNDRSMIGQALNFGNISGTGICSTPNATALLQSPDLMTQLTSVQDQLQSLEDMPMVKSFYDAAETSCEVSERAQDMFDTLDEILDAAETVEVFAAGGMLGGDYPGIILARSFDQRKVCNTV
ncbi:unnamed protein product [Symbiodinium natans]|uniref:Uncharacterized protein n=1 Tax=Symbiodinium natans TaxID=878477 RepID=A0A812KXU7_9DINO|nr:unnamed protein product [Symbiodinium natans]